MVSLIPPGTEAAGRDGDHVNIEYEVYVGNLPDNATEVRSRFILNSMKHPGLCDPLSW